MNGIPYLVDFATSLRGRFPIPPTLSEGAAELLTKWLTEAFWADACLHQRTHRIVCVQSAELERLATEILRTPFPMPCEGIDEPITTIDQVVMQPTEVIFTISDIYAAYLLVASPDDFPTRKRSTDKQLLPLDESQRPLIVAALQSHHMRFTTAWTCQAVHMCSSGLRPAAREAFGLPQIEMALRALGATPAP